MDLLMFQTNYARLANIQRMQEKGGQEFHKLANFLTPICLYLAGRPALVYLPDEGVSHLQCLYLADWGV